MNRISLFNLLSGIVGCLSMLALSPFSYGEINTNPDSMAQPQALKAVGLFSLKELEPNLNGASLSAAIICRSLSYADGLPQNDYQPFYLHKSLKSAQFKFYHRNHLPPAFCPHSTAICSILFGRDDQAYDNAVGSFSYQGIIPEANANIYELWAFLTDIVYPQSRPDADVIIAGFGNVCEDWWTRGIESLAEKYGLTIIAPIGNGTDSYDVSLYPAAGANVIGVGVVDSVNTKDAAANLSYFSLPSPHHSSFGPTGKHLCKPDIVAPGNYLAAAVGDPNAYRATGNWTSFAAPVVGGVAGLLIQKAKLEPALSAAVDPTAGNCVIKAILMNSAVKLPFWHKGRLEKDDDHTAPLDYLQGAGLVNARAAYEQLIAGQEKTGIVKSQGWDLDYLQNDKRDVKTYQIVSSDPNKKTLTATLVWNRHYKQKIPFEPLPQEDADLRVELWAFDPYIPASAYLLDYSDSPTDNVEHIYCKLDPNYTHYQLIVSCNDSGTGRNSAKQNYALAWNVSQMQDNDNILLYDLNADGVVSQSDTLVLLDNWTNSVQSPGYYFIGDINNDGTFDAEDLDILNSQIGRKAPWYIE